MLQPKRTKFRKKQKGRVKGIAQRGHTISFGSFGIKSLKPGTIMFEAGGVTTDLAKEALRLAAQKLPVRTKFVTRRDYVE